MSADSIQRIEVSSPLIVSLVIPHFSSVRRENLEGLLKEIRQQSFQGIEVLIVSGVSPQGRAINQGARAARGKILVVMDDDSRIGHDKVIEYLVRALEKDPAIGMAGAPVITPESANAFQRKAAKEFPRFHMPLVSEITDSDLPCHGCVAFPMELFKKVGMEREDILRGLDPDLRVRIRKAGFRVILVPETWVYHPLPETLWKFIRVFIRNGFGSAYMQWVHPELNYDTDEQLELGDFAPKKPFLYRIIRFPFRLLQSLVTFQWIRFLGYSFYLAGYVSGFISCLWNQMLRSMPREKTQIRVRP